KDCEVIVDKLKKTASRYITTAALGHTIGEKVREAVQQELLPKTEDPPPVPSPLKMTLQSTQTSPDMVNHPPHYTSHPSGVECIQVTEHMNFCLGNAIKYLWRADS